MSSCRTPGAPACGSAGATWRDCRTRRVCRGSAARRPALRYWPSEPFSPISWKGWPCRWTPCGNAVSWRGAMPAVHRQRQAPAGPVIRTGFRLEPQEREGNGNGKRLQLAANDPSVIRLRRAGARDWSEILLQTRRARGHASLSRIGQAPHRGHQVIRKPHHQLPCVRSARTPRRALACGIPCHARRGCIAGSGLRRRACGGASSRRPGPPVGRPARAPGAASPRRRSRPRASPDPGADPGLRYPTKHEPC